MPSLTPVWTAAVALGIGLLVGIERERRKGTGPGRRAAGIRTFALTGLLGGLTMEVPRGFLVAIAGTFVAAAALLGYVRRRDRDPGLTTAVALMVTFVLGALAHEAPLLAAGSAVVVAVVLAERSRLHSLVREKLTEQEFEDGLLLAAAALVILPVVPDRQLGPFGAFNPFTLWRLVVLMMAINGAGYVALRVLGPRLGLAAVGFASGFVSSTATIGAMASRAAGHPSLVRHAVAGAVLSTVATVVQMLLVLGATSTATLDQLAVPLLAAGIVAAAYGAVFVVRAVYTAAPKFAPGRAFDLRTTLFFATTFATVGIASAALQRWLGETGLSVSTAVAGLVDTHAAAASIAALVAAGKLAPAHATVPILIGFSTNALSKLVMAASARQARFTLAVGSGIVLVVAAAWVAAVVRG